uniref:Reverse transcriptase domain-containing protein n=1 Tax=Phytophthora ramorum TaxID=164328 RepID=H3H5C4_PHYRM
MGPGEPPRAVPLLGTDDASAAATSGTGPGPAAPIAPRPLTRLEAAAGQETPRPASTTSRRFGDPLVDPPSAGDSGRSAGAGGSTARSSNPARSSTSVAVPTDGTEGARQTKTRSQQQTVQRSGGKRRRLNAGDDEDQRELAELLLVDEDKAGAEHPALRLPTASAHPASVLSVYAHAATRFDCTLCTYTAASLASLKRHRSSRHRRTAFLDKFLAGCACGTPFASRLAAARHAQACANLCTTSATTSTAAKASSPTAAGVRPTVRAVVTAAPDLPRQYPSELVAPPPAAELHQRCNAGPGRRRAAGAKSLGPTAPSTAGGLSGSQPDSARIADRLAPPSPDLSLLDEEMKESEPPDPTHHSADEDSTDAEAADAVMEPAFVSDPPTATPREWRLQFDGACRGGPNPGGAGALLYNPEGAVVWTGSHYMPGAKETNNTAEYTALLIGARAAADHGARQLRIEGDSLLVIRQVKGLYATKSTRLRQLRNAVRHELARVGQHSLHHIDRQGNAFADRLANRALDLKSDKVECKEHPVAGACTTCMGSPSAGPPATPPPTTADIEMADAGSDDELRADIDDGEVYAPMRLEPGVIPTRRSRLRLRQLTDDEMEAAGEVVERLSAGLSAKIADADDWETAEGYITALPYMLYDKLQQYTQVRHGTAHSPAPHPQRRDVQGQVETHREPQHETIGQPDQPGEPSPTRRRRRGKRKGRRQRRHPRRTNCGGGGRQQRKQRHPRPPRGTRHHREHRIDEAIDELHALERARPQARPAIAKARRRVGRIRSAIDQQLLRHRFDTAEKECVDGILAAARTARDARTTVRAAAATGTTATPETAVTSGTEQQDDNGTCPIPSEVLWRHFDSVNTPQRDFDPEAPEGAAFRSAMARLPAATRFMELLKEAPSTDGIEVQLQHASSTSSPGLDGVGYDVYKRFASQLLPVLKAAFKCCWTHKQVPQSWKLGVVRLLYKKGDREDPANWRPICLQQAIYKIYTGVLARRLTRWQDANDRHAPGQKGFRPVNGCGEHNFLAAMLIDHARRKHRPLYEVWYDFRNAFGSVPLGLLWDALERTGVPAEYIAAVQGLYDHAAFMVGNAVDGSTAPILQRVGVFQGCPLSPPLFSAAISPLLHALQLLPSSGVQLSGDDRPGVSAYADDLKTFSGTKAGVTEQHELVAMFLRWTGMAANPAKCRSMGVRRNGNGAIEADHLELALDDTPIPTLTHLQSYTYLGIGDGFDHPRDDPESSGLAKAAAEKKAKYAGIKRHLERQGWKVHLSALVYGSLGSVAPSNYKVYTEHLGLLKRDAKRLDRQLSVACIQSSRRIWNLHCAQHRARQHQDQPASRGRRVTETGGTPSRTDRR